MESKRDTVFDIVRSFCVLEIVAFWHLLDYASKSPVSDNFRHGAGTVLTISVLTVFTFMSGHFLKKYSIGSMKDVLSFYKKRLSRFFPLFFLSSLSLFVAGVGAGGSLRDATLPLWALCLIVLPVVIAGSYLIQKTYDRILSRK